MAMDWQPPTLRALAPRTLLRLAHHACPLTTKPSTSSPLTRDTACSRRQTSECGQPSARIVHARSWCAAAQCSRVVHCALVWHRLYGFGPVTGAPAPMSGFIKSYAPIMDNSTGTADGSFIMKCFAPSHVPVISTLASEFTLIDHWFVRDAGCSLLVRGHGLMAVSDCVGIAAFPAQPKLTGRTPTPPPAMVTSATTRSWST